MEQFVFSGGSEGGGESGVDRERDSWTPELGRFEHLIFNMQKYFCEFFAALVIVSAVAFGLAKEGGGHAAPLSITSTIFALITLFKDISGAHFNPAVSCTIYMTDPRFTLVDLLCYVAAQLIGGTVGAFIGYGIMGKALDILPLDPGMSASRQLFHEVIPTMVMIYAVLVLVFGYGVMWELTVPFVVGACVLAGAFAGATMNPAVTFGIFISNICTENTNIDVAALLVTLFGPFLGAMFAFLSYVGTHAYQNPVPLRFLNFRGL
ncbi:UNVERIFIED_CONTAM: aquaporin 1 [Hammondia hammondi]|eukprot:XP_008886653.1 aquaporin 1 [Hammondia hammondi]